MPSTKLQVDRQLPIGDELFLDHVGHFGRDVDAANRALAPVGFAPPPPWLKSSAHPRAGFPQLTAPATSPAMFARGYIEVLFKTADTPLTREFDAGLARYPGVHLAAFAAADAAAAHARLAGEGFRVRPLVHMQRPVDTGGAPGTAALPPARVRPGGKPGGRPPNPTPPTPTTGRAPRRR